MSESESIIDTYILVAGSGASSRALRVALDTLVGDRLPYAMGTSAEEALSGRYRRVIDCTRKPAGFSRIDVINVDSLSLVDIINALKE